MRFLIKEEWEIDLAKRDGYSPQKIKDFIEEIYNIIFQVKKELGLDHETFGIALTFFHYYTYLKSLRQIESMELSIACVFLACKIKFYNVPVDRFNNVYNKLKAKKSNNSDIKQTPINFYKYEVEIYSFLGYDLDIASPYFFYYDLISNEKFKNLGATETKCLLFNFINDSYRKPLCLYFHPKVIMIACLILTFKMNDNDDKQIEELCQGEDLNNINDCLEKIIEIFDENVK